jgi:hypothetical protein
LTVPGRTPKSPADCPKGEGADVDHVEMRSRNQVHEGWTFIRHFLEMCVAMCVGGGLMNALIFVAGPALMGYSDLREGTPALALVVIALIYLAPMAAWMRFRGMPWRPILEMSGAVIALAVVFIGLAAFDAMSESDLRSSALGFCGPACVVMLPVMLLRLDLYTGRIESHGQQAAASPLRHWPATGATP